MSATSPRFTIGRLMAAVAVSAEVFALFRMTNRTGPSAILLLMPLVSASSLLPVCFARPGRWLLRATWLAALWPLSIVPVVYAAFGVATLAMGRPPTYGDKSPLLSHIESVLIATFFSSIAASLVGFYLPLCARGRPPGKARRWNPQAIPVLLIAPAWFLAWEILYLDLTPLRWMDD